MPRCHLRATVSKGSTLWRSLRPTQGWTTPRRNPNAATQAHRRMKHRPHIQIELWNFHLCLNFDLHQSFSDNPKGSIVFKGLRHTICAFDTCLLLTCPCRCRFDLGSTCRTTAPKCRRGWRSSHHYAAGSRSANISRLSFTRAKDSPRIDCVCSGSCFQQMIAISPWHYRKWHSTRGTTTSKDSSCWWSNAFSARDVGNRATCHWFLRWA